MRTHYIIRVDSEEPVEAEVYSQFAATLRKALYDLLSNADTLYALCKTNELTHAHSETEIRFTDSGHIASSTLVALERKDGKLVTMTKTPLSDLLKPVLPFAVKVTKNQVSAAEMLGAQFQ